MSELEIKNSTFVDKLLYLDKCLSSYSKEEIVKNDGVKSSKTDEDSLIELSDEFGEEISDEKIKKTVERIFQKMNLNDDDKVSEEELEKFKDLLDEIGIKPSEMTILLDEFAITVQQEYADILVDLKKSLLGDTSSLSESQDNTSSNNTLNSVDNSNQTSTPSYSNYSTSATPSYSSGSSGETVPVTTTTYTYEPIEDNSSEIRIEEIKKEIEALESKKTEQQEVLDNAKEKLSSAQNDTEASIKEKKDEKDELESKYKELLASNAESDPVVMEYKNQLEENEEAIKENAENLADYESDLSSKEEEISAKESSIKSLESSKTALEKALKAVNNTKVTDENKSQIEAKKSSLNTQIQEKEKEIKTAKEELETLNEEKEEIETKVDELNKTKITLQEKHDEIEANIEKSADKATKEALSAYQDALSAYEEQKEAKISEAQENISNAQGEITKIQGQIDELKAEQIQEENKIKEVQYKKVAHTTTTYVSSGGSSSGSYSASPVSYSSGVESTNAIQDTSAVSSTNQITGTQGSYDQYNAQRGQALANAAKSLYGGVSKGNSRCATGVSQAITKAFGYTTHGNGCDYGNVLAQRSDWVEITDQVKTVDDLKKLPAGAIVSWSAYNTSSLGRLYGHVYICDGQGHGISDFTENISSYYMDRNSKWRVFLPV